MRMTNDNNSTPEYHPTGTGPADMNQSTQRFQETVVGLLALIWLTLLGLAFLIWVT